MIKMEISKVTKISGKGKLLEISEDGFLMEDEKDKLEELLSFDDLRKLVGKSISFSFSLKEESEQLEEE